MSPENYQLYSELSPYQQFGPKCSQFLPWGWDPQVNDVLVQSFVCWLLCCLSLLKTVLTHLNKTESNSILALFVPLGFRFIPNRVCNSALGHHPEKKKKYKNYFTLFCSTGWLHKMTVPPDMLHILRMRKGNFLLRVEETKETLPLAMSNDDSSLFIWAHCDYAGALTQTQTQKYET